MAIAMMTAKMMTRIERGALEGGLRKDWEADLPVLFALGRRAEDRLRAGSGFAMPRGSVGGHSSLGCAQDIGGSSASTLCTHYCRSLFSRKLSKAVL